MITTNRKTVGDCTACPSDSNTHKSLAATDGLRPGSRIPQGLCYPCYDRAGDENAVSDGTMTCALFLAQWGEHSDYCDCAPAQPVGTRYAVTLTQDDLRHLVALAVRDADRSEDGRMSGESIALLTAINAATTL